MRLPNIGTNWIPDYGWDLFELQWNGQDFVNTFLGHVADAGNDADDNDNQPVGATSGDNLIRFEEYRGFVVGVQHRRTSPQVKDVFAVNNTSALFQDAQQIGVRWHTPQLDNVSAMRRINFNSTGIPGHLDQQAVLVFNAPAPENNTAGGQTPCADVTPFVCYPNVIGGMNAPTGTGFDNWDVANNVKVFEETVRILTPDTNSPIIPDEPLDTEVFRSDLGHELGHAIGIANNTVDNTSIMRPVLVLNDDWTSIPHAYLANDLSQVRLK